MFGSILGGIEDTISDFARDPIGKTVNTVTQPLRDVASVASGLSQGEIRAEAIVRLGADVALGMTTAEVLEWYNDL